MQAVAQQYKRKRVQKRRRVEGRRTEDNRGSTTTPKSYSTEVQQTHSTLSEMQVIVTSCVSCHRTLTGRAGNILLCARCKSHTCNICSRTCEGSPSTTLPASQRMAVSPPATPKRIPLNFTTSENVDTGSTATRTTTKLHKRELDSEDAVDAMSDEDDSGDTETDAKALGCGRTVCRDCCMEDAMSHLVCCLDCQAAS